MLRNDLKKEVFIRCVELHLESGKPVGSKILKKRFFEDLGDSTIRLYLNKLSKERLLENVKNYCGRKPTDYGWRCFLRWNIDNIILNDEELRTIKSMSLIGKIMFLSSLLKIYYILRESDGHMVEGGLENILKNREFRKNENIADFAVFLTKAKKYLDQLSRKYKDESLVLYIGKEFPLNGKESTPFSFIAKRFSNKFICFLALKRINYPYLVKLIEHTFK